MCFSLDGDILKSVGEQAENKGLLNYYNGISYII